MTKYFANLFNLIKDRLFESGLSCYETQYWGKDTSFRKLDLMVMASSILPIIWLISYGP